MLHGCQKTVIHLAETDSEMFDEAYFIVKRKASPAATASERDMVREANRLLDRAGSESDRTRRKRKQTRRLCLLCFCCGALCSALLFLLIG